jgi:hypothetical protein
LNRVKNKTALRKYRLLDNVLSPRVNKHFGKYMQCNLPSQYGEYLLVDREIRLSGSIAMCYFWVFDINAPKDDW